MNDFDSIAIIVSSVCLVVYHIVFIVETISESQQLRSSRHRSLMDLWVSKHLPVLDNTNKYPVVAIQLIRNCLYCAIFIGGYTLSSFFRIITSIAHYQQARSIGQIIVGTCLLGSFLCWGKVIRNFVHLSYVIGSWNPIVDPSTSADGFFTDIDAASATHIQSTGDHFSNKSSVNGSNGSGTNSGNSSGRVSENSSRSDHLDVDMEEALACHATSENAYSEPTRSEAHRGDTGDSNAISVNLTRELHYDFGCVLARDSVVYFSFAFKFLYISVPYSFYVSFGPTTLLVVTVIILALEIVWDYGYSWSSYMKTLYRPPVSINTNSSRDTGAASINSNNSQSVLTTSVFDGIHTGAGIDGGVL